MSAQGPIWILAAPFCGASRLAARLGLHPQLRAAPELNLFLAGDVGGLLDAFRIGQGDHAQGLLEAVAQIEFGDCSDAALAAAADWLDARRSLTLPGLVVHLAERAAPHRLVVPDSESPLRPQDLDLLRQCQPPCAIIHLVRHPWRQGEHMAAWARGRLFVPPDFKDHGFHPAQVDPQIPWLRCNRNILSMLADGADAPAWRLRVEEVEANPHTLRPVLDALGLRTDDEAMAAMAARDGWTFPASGAKVPAPALLGAVREWVINRGSRPDGAETALDAPARWLPETGRLDPLVCGLAREFGYR